MWRAGVFCFFFPLESKPANEGFGLIGGFLFFFYLMLFFYVYIYIYIYKSIKRGEIEEGEGDTETLLTNQKAEVEVPVLEHLGYSEPRDSLQLLAESRGHFSKTTGV